VADSLLVLQRRALDELPPVLHSRTFVVQQSASASGPVAPLARCTELCVVGHLREEKDPLLATRALALLPAAVRGERPLRVTHVGRALDPELEQQARAARWLFESWAFTANKVNVEDAARLRPGEPHIQVWVAHRALPLLRRAAELLHGTGVRVGCVVGFPHGANATEVKRFETETACRDGAVEIDVVINVEISSIWRTITPSMMRSPSWNNGLLSMPLFSRARASRLAFVMFESALRSLKLRAPANRTKYSLPSSRRNGRIAGDAFFAMRLARLICATVNLSFVLSTVARPVAWVAE
jgi:hypothetical protein